MLNSGSVKAMNLSTLAPTPSTTLTLTVFSVVELELLFRRGKKSPGVTVVTGRSDKLIFCLASLFTFTDSKSFSPHRAALRSIRGVAVHSLTLVSTVTAACWWLPSHSLSCSPSLSLSYSFPPLNPSSLYFSLTLLHSHFKCHIPSFYVTLSLSQFTHAAQLITCLRA